jgi:hypothetical protein
MTMNREQLEKADNLSIILDQLDHFLMNHPWTEDWGIDESGAI